MKIKDIKNLIKDKIINFITKVKKGGKPSISIMTQKSIVFLKVILFVTMFIKNLIIMRFIIKYRNVIFKQLKLLIAIHEKSLKAIL